MSWIFQKFPLKQASKIFFGLATQRSIATANLAAAQMNRDMAFAMGGAWGPWIW